MSKRIDNLKDLFVEQGRELYDATLQEQKELPAIKKQASNQRLKNAIDRQIISAKSQSERIEEAFDRLNLPAEGEKSECCLAVFRKTQSIIDRSKDSEVRDAAIINSIQRLNHNKISSLGAAASYAREIGQQEIANTFHKILNEEKAIDRELSDLAEEEINKKALVA